MIALSTFGRGEAILDLHDHQIDRGLVSFLDTATPEYFDCDCYDAGKQLEGASIEAGICKPVLSADGTPKMHPPTRKLGETEGRPVLRGKGAQIPLPHTVITEMNWRGVVEAQIDAASGHAGEGGRTSATVVTCVPTISTS
ncbi:MAG: hypothetical protein EOO77_08100 [Oxalobacteraceae bacterium]|nr:MAG: hypothetical protein EOO77_08100 [Oxalobacteraceae bacterium]